MRTIILCLFLVGCSTVEPMKPKVRIIDEGINICGPAIAEEQVIQDDGIYLIGKTRCQQNEAPIKNPPKRV